MLIILLAGLASCTGREIKVRLADIESHINEKPDSALAAIRDIDTTALRGRAVKAKYSLLHAMALDKNYIDTADTRIVQPAVEYYGRHGSSEERLKAYMYFGTEQFYAGKYNEAIVSFNQAAEESNEVSDLNLLGVLYSKMGDTFTKTMDHAQAGAYIDKSLECFRLCGRKDQEALELLRKAGNLSQRRKRIEADSCYLSLLADSTINKNALNRARIDYAMFLLSSPDSDETKAMEQLSSALEGGATFYDVSQLYSYAYLLNRSGKIGESAALFTGHPPKGTIEKYTYYYWKHRINLLDDDYRAAYTNLWSAFNYRDSLLESIYEVSAANSQRDKLVSLNEAKRVSIQSQRRLLLIISLLCIITGLCAWLLYLLYQKGKQRIREETDRMNLVLESLRSQMAENKRSDKSKAKFAFLGEIYEDVYRNTERAKVDNAFIKALESKIGDLRSNKKARENFEGLLDKEMDDVMTRFRKDCPGLTDQEYHMASLYFAGFDNTTVMIIMGLSTLENVRTRKRRLKKKILDLYSSIGEHYVSLIS